MNDDGLNLSSRALEFQQSPDSVAAMQDRFLPKNPTHATNRADVRLSWHTDLFHENRHREKVSVEVTETEAAVVGAAEVTGAVTASTLTTLAVLFPSCSWLWALWGQIYRCQALTGIWPRRTNRIAIMRGSRYIPLQAGGRAFSFHMRRSAPFCDSPSWSANRPFALFS